jgi:arginyl-tRNA synthetase
MTVSREGTSVTEKDPSPLHAFKQEAATALARASGLDAGMVLELLQAPPRADMGDLAFPCFALAKERKTAPPVIAKEIAAAFSATTLPAGVATVQPAGPYVNLTLDRDLVTRTILDHVLSRGQAYGDQDIGRGKPVVIDYSSPNVAKPFGIGHLRSTVIGAAIVRILRALGHEVFGINHLGDWGTQFGKMMVACQKWGTPGPDDPDPVKTTFELYVRFHQEAESDPSLEEEGRAWFARLEQGDAEARRYWDLLTEIGKKEFARIYDKLGIRFEHFTGESFYNDKLDETVDVLRKKGLLTTSQEAQIVDLSAWDMPPALMKKADDSSLYLTRDLAALFYRYETFRFHRALYVVGMEQTLHFRQLFKVAELLGLEWAKGCEHVPFGLIRFKDGKMSTRKGKVIFLEEVLDRAVEMVRGIIAEKNPDLENKDEVAREVGIGAIVFNDLKHRRVKDVQFDWSEILNFDGKTGPYLQYSHARIGSILRKAGEEPPARVPEGASLSLQEEWDLTLRLADLPSVLRAAGNEAEPSLVSTYILDLAEVFNRYYNLGGKDPALRVLCEDPDVRQARLCLVRAVETVLKKGLSLLGVGTPEKM